MSTVGHLRLSYTGKLFATAQCERARALLCDVINFGGKLVREVIFFIMLLTPPVLARQLSSSRATRSIPNPKTTSSDDSKRSFLLAHATKNISTKYQRPREFLVAHCMIRCLLPLRFVSHRISQLIGPSPWSRQSLRGLKVLGARISISGMSKSPQIHRSFCLTHQFRDYSYFSYSQFTGLTSWGQSS